jgi:hypothetical protein
MKCNEECSNVLPCLPDCVLAPLLHPLLLRDALVPQRVLQPRRALSTLLELVDQVGVVVLQVHLGLRSLVLGVAREGHERVGFRGVCGADQRGGDGGPRRRSRRQRRGGGDRGHGNGRGRADERLDRK